ncbi:NifB/NifX family molybdenum-iron cluster-binding protein [Uliginosibacterium sp. 31-16]|uniref:NifB/NifX family molybdenum-iron cluster-binding protein n=1 Tax=Uliginosibacterium sp. 31-16 TaxID=3068315 RepID=UPI00273DB64D|nr:NifB/NifX family molybdenum-iron cluster-binding protein [Uliginosibacterium sp. 31-16]MDP5239291.1 NifB/NifX family molybdenum-iron cluster-binding protein [Uliginosibacterium sp. 31-16]
MLALILGTRAKPAPPPVRWLALACQNRHSLSPHAGRCRHFLIFDLAAPAGSEPQRLDLSPQQSLFALQADAAHPLDGVDMLIARSIGVGIRDKLALRGIHTRVTEEADPQRIVQGFLAGSLITRAAEASPAGGRRQRGLACMTPAL